MKNYRPISLLSIFGKTLECIISRRLVRLLECRHLLSPFQLGFRKGKEMTDAGWRLTHNVVEALQTRHQVQAMALDIQSAYDTMWHAGLLTKMKGMGIDDYLIQWIRSFLHGRQGILEVGMAQKRCNSTVVSHKDPRYRALSF